MRRGTVAYNTRLTEWAMRDSNSFECIGENEENRKSGAESGAVGVDSGLKRLAELWENLTKTDRQALMDHAEHLAALRSKIVVSTLD